MRINYTKELLENAVKEAYSYAEVCRKIGLKPIGGNYKTLKKKLNEFNIDYSHFTGQSWNKGISKLNKISRFKLEEILQENINYSSHALKKRLISENIKNNKCEICEISGEEISLELHHINGDHYDNRIENLQILCPNCHSKTENFRGKNLSKKESPINLSKKYSKNHYMICLNCKKEFYSDRTDRVRKFCCRECYSEYLKKVHTGNAESLQDNVPNLDIPLTKENILKQFDNYKDLTNFGKHFGVSRTTMRNYLIKYDLYDKFKLKYDFHAKPVIQMDLKGNIIKEWPSITDAEKSLNIQSIDKAASGNRRSAGGYLWRYL